MQPQKKKIFFGGAGAGKSVSIVQFICKRLIEEQGIRILVLRKYFPSMKVSTYLVIKAVLDSWGISYTEHKTDHFIKVGESYVYYMSLEDVERFKGSEFKLVWMEETTEFLEDDYKQLSIRLARDKNSEDVTMIMSFNPIDVNHWCCKMIDFARQNPDDFLVHHSTYRDNRKNLSRTFVKELQDLAKTDENFYRVYTLGEPGVLKNKIYNHFQIEDSSKWPWPKLNAGIHVYGLDFGFNHPMSLCEVFFCEDEFYVRELFYRRECTTDDLALWMQVNKVDHKCYVYADSAEPDRIDSLCKDKMITSNVTGKTMTTHVKKYLVVPAKKDVHAGIDFIKSKKVHLCSKSVNAIKEVQNYRYKTTKSGEVIDEPIKALDDFLDSFRYAAFSMKISHLGNIPEGFSNGYSFSSRLSVKQFRL